MIKVSNCTKKYGDFTAVDNLSLEVQKGEIFGFLGPNGAGKSTTIKMMVGLIRPDSGEIMIGGHNIITDPQNAKKILAYIPEKGYIFEKMTAWEYLHFIGGLYGIEEGELKRQADKYLSVFNLTDWKDEIIANFSHGMRQRLILTSAMMRKPLILILDEPHNGLDPKGIRLLRDLLFDLRSRGMTIILCTHIIAIAEQMCDRIAIMNRGRIAAEGTKTEIRQYAASDDRTLEDIFLRLTSDYTEQGADK